MHVCVCVRARRGSHRPDSRWQQPSAAQCAHLRLVPRDPGPSQWRGGLQCAGFSWRLPVALSACSPVAPIPRQPPARERHRRSLGGHSRPKPESACACTCSNAIWTQGDRPPMPGPQARPPASAPASPQTVRLTDAQACVSPVQGGPQGASTQGAADLSRAR